MNAIARAIDALNEGFGRLIAPLLAVITLIVVYDIAMRFFIGRPSDWAFDVTKMLFGAHFMLMAAYGLRHHATWRSTCSSVCCRGASRQRSRSSAT
ncbi:tripartite ATP-independent periplasmic transporter, DctQ component [Halomonas elongata]|uniref:TRAP transporter small permease protein n=1 Tax=Halomonas elongata TaxID=2746 RepID=A0A1B8NXV2_HALEL|nr:tripartite ATP-independent periplasmic transporter, DctQ component [Halomonas elongata]